MESIKLVACGLFIKNVARNENWIVNGNRIFLCDNIANSVDGKTSCQQCGSCLCEFTCVMFHQSHGFYFKNNAIKPDVRLSSGYEKWGVKRSKS